jgi:hypothetical protein
MWKDGEEEVDLKKDGLNVLDMREIDVSDEVTNERGQWKEKTCCADPK